MEEKHGAHTKCIDVSQVVFIDYISCVMRKAPGPSVTGLPQSRDCRVQALPYAAFDVEKIIRTVGRGKKKKHFVKYLHYGKEHNEWYVTS